MTAVIMYERLRPRPRHPMMPLVPVAGRRVDGADCDAHPLAGGVAARRANSWLLQRGNQSDGEP